MRDKMRVGYGKQDDGGFRDRASAGPAAAAPRLQLKQLGRWRPLLRWWASRREHGCCFARQFACWRVGRSANPDSLWLNEECLLVAVCRCGGWEVCGTCIVGVGGLGRGECVEGRCVFSNVVWSRCGGLMTALLSSAATAQWLAACDEVDWVGVLVLMGRGTRLLVAVMLTLSAFVQAACGGSHPGPVRPGVVLATPASGVFDQPVHIVVSHVGAHREVNRETAVGRCHRRRVQRASHVSLQRGRPGRSRVRAGERWRLLSGVDPMGLIDSMQPASGRTALYRWNGAQPRRFVITVSEGTSLARLGWIYPPGVRAGRERPRGVDRRHGVLRSVLGAAPGHPAPCGGAGVRRLGGPTVRPGGGRGGTRLGGLSHARYRLLRRAGITGDADRHSA